MLHTGSVSQKSLVPKISFTGKIAQFLHGHELHLGLPALLQIQDITETQSESLHDLKKWQISVIRNAPFPNTEL